MPTPNAIKRPWVIVRRGKRRETRDGRYVIFAHFGMYWAAKDVAKCTCARHACYCEPITLPGGIAGTGFEDLTKIQAALKAHYRGYRKAAANQESNDANP